jgi:transposase
VRLCGMRKGVTVEVTPADRAHLQSIIRDRNSPQKHVWRAQIIVLTADGAGTTAITRTVGKGKTVVCRWQERFMHQGVEGLTRDKTRPSRIPPSPVETVDRVVALTNQAPPHEATHYAVSRIMPHGRASRRVNLFRAMRQFGIIRALRGR